MLVNLWLSVYAADQKNTEPKLQGKDGFALFVNRLKTAAKDELVARSKKADSKEDKKTIKLAAMRAAAGSE